jgi:hypothetical protein
VAARVGGCAVLNCAALAAAALGTVTALTVTIITAPDGSYLRAFDVGVGFRTPLAAAAPTSAMRMDTGFAAELPDALTHTAAIATESRWSAHRESSCLWKGLKLETSGPLTMFGHMTILGEDDVTRQGKCGGALLDFRIFDAGTAR